MNAANQPSSGISLAIHKAGGVTKLSRAIHVSRAVLYSWLNQGYVPPVRAIQLEEMFDIPRAKLLDPMLTHGSFDEVEGRLIPRNRSAINDLL